MNVFTIVLMDYYIFSSKILLLGAIRRALAIALPNFQIVKMRDMNYPATHLLFKYLRACPVEA